MRLVLDLQGGQTPGNRHRGIGRCSRALALAMAREAENHEVWILLNEVSPPSIRPMRRLFEAHVPPERFAVFGAPGPSVVSARNDWRAQVAARMRESFLADLEPDFVHVGSLFEGLLDSSVVSIGALESLPTAVTHYDLIPHLCPQAYLKNPIVERWYRAQTEHLRRADLLLAISDSTRREVIDELGIDPDRVVTISSDAEPTFRRLDLTDDEQHRVLLEVGLSLPFVLGMGAGEHRRNPEGLIRAFARIPTDARLRHQLAIVSRIGDDERERLSTVGRDAGLADNELVLPSHVSDDALVTLYNLCRLFVFPSLREGFGLPALEAMRCGAPVIGSKRGSIPEVIGWSDALFDPSSTEDMAALVHRGLTDDAFRERLRRNGEDRQALFSWRASARVAVAAMEAAAPSAAPTASAPPAAGAPRGATEVPSEERWLERRRRVVRAIGELPGTATASDQELADVARLLTANERHPLHQRQLLVDVSTLVHIDSKSGIQRVVRGILGCLLQRPPRPFRVEPVYRHADGYRYARRFGAEFTGLEDGAGEDPLVVASPDDVFLGLDLDPANDRLGRAWLRRHVQRGMRAHFVLYDLLPITRGDCFPKEFADPFLAWLENMTRLATGVVAISGAVADEYADWLRARPGAPAIGSFHLGADIEASRPTRGIPDETHRQLAALDGRPVFLMVGKLEPRKRHMQVLLAVERLWARGVDVALIFAGHSGWMLDELYGRIRRQSEAGRPLLWLESPSDELLVELYGRADALIQASSAEGFGLPLIEAAQHGLPIIARDLPVFREVAGEHAYYFSGDGAGELADSLQEWLALREGDGVPTTNGMTWLSWEESARQLLDVIQGEKWRHPARL